VIRDADVLKQVINAQMTVTAKIVGISGLSVEVLRSPVI